MAPWARQLAELAAVYPTRADLAADLGVCAATLAAWLAGASPPNTLNRLGIGELYGSVSPLGAVEQAVVIVRQALDAVLEMRTVEMAHVQAERGRAALDALARSLRRTCSDRSDGAARG